MSRRNTNANSGSWLASLDMYRKVPADLMEGSQEGKAVSWIALLVMGFLFFRETQEFLQPQPITDIHLDTSKVKRVRVDFNMTLLDLRCEFATVNYVSFLGTQHNVTKDITRYHMENTEFLEDLEVHSRGSSQTRLREDIIFHDPSITETIEDLHANGKDSIALDAESLDYALEDYEFVFVKYYANWCSHCKALAPTWERFAEVIHDVEEKTKAHLGTDYTLDEYKEAKNLTLPVLIGEVDCVEHKELCWDEEIRGYPTLVLYVNGERYKDGEYAGDRTVNSFLQFLIIAEEQTKEKESDKIKQHAQTALEKHFNMTTGHKEWLNSMNRSLAHEAQIWDKNEHPGCRLVGSLHLNRAPGYFYVEAQSAHHDLDPSLANMSHIVHHLSFHAVEEDDEDNGESSRKQKGKDEEESKPDFAPSHYDHAVAPLDGHVYLISEWHQSWHHYLKLVSITNTDRFQVLPSSQVSLYREDHYPEAKVILDISPIAVRWRVSYRPWYSYVTSLMAILGGTFTVVGLLEYGVESASRKISRSRQRRVLPRPPPPAGVNGSGRPRVAP